MTTKIKFPNRRFAAVRMTGGIREILDLADKMEKEGRSIIHMDLGCPDFDSPRCAKDAAIKALLDGQVHYTNMSGTDELRRAVAEKYIRENSVPCDADVNIVITAGAMEAMAVAFLTTLDRGDEVILPAPYFPAYADQIAMAGADIKEVQAQEENSFHVTVDQLEAALTPKSRILVLNTPNNPSGAVLSRDDLYKIADFAIRNDLWVISDECYEKFVYNAEHISIASLPGMAERTITVSAASKTWSMTGWRVGWLICPPEMYPYAAKCHQDLSTCATSFAQTGVAEALKHADEDVRIMIREYARRREMVLKWLGGTEGVKCIAPEGAFYVFPNISSFGMDGFAFCRWLLEDAGVSTTPGEVFGVPGYIRMAYGKSYEYVEEGMKRFRKAVEKL